MVMSDSQRCPENLLRINNVEDIVVHLGRKVHILIISSPTVEIRSSYFCSKSIIESNQFLLKTLISSPYLIRQIFLGYHVEIRHCFAIFTSRVIWLYACILYMRPRSVIWAVDLDPGPAYEYCFLFKYLFCSFFTLKLYLKYENLSINNFYLGSIWG